MHTIEKDENNLIIKIPLKERRFNPYDQQYHEEMNNIVGVITNINDIGFAHWIDMDYKGKSDQVSETFYQYDGSEEDFEKLCKKLGIDIVKMYYDRCNKCNKILYGAHTVDKNGSLCFECENKKNKKL